MFKIKKCSCGKEIWYHTLSGKVEFENQKLYINDGSHSIPFNDFVKSLGIHENDTVTINIEKGEK